MVVIMDANTPSIRPRNLGDLYRLAATHYGGMPAFATRGEDGSHWNPLSFEELYSHGRALAAALLDLGLEKGENIAVFADNRVEWIIADCAVQLCGAVNVPRGSDTTDGELKFILSHCQARFCLTENKRLAKRVQALCSDNDLSIRQILLDGDSDKENYLSLQTLMDKGLKLLEQDAQWAEQLDELLETVTADDPFTLIYTSCTTGEPKGVLLTHGNMLAQIRHIPIPINWRDRVLSILPIWHVYERVLEMITVARGCCTFYSSVRHFADDLLTVEPTFMASAPRLWERLHARIMQTIAKAHPVRRGLFHMACFFSAHYHAACHWLGGHAVREKRPVLVLDGLRTLAESLRWLLFLPFHGFFNAAVLERVRLSVGGCLRGTISGGGALPRPIDRFFNSMGIPVLEGYGLTETAPVLAVRRLDCQVQTSVGPMIPETQLRIVDIDSGKVLYPDPNRSDNGRMLKGEIQVKGPQVMQGYYKNREATDKAFVDGWFRTGDLGMVTWNDCLRIAGRCKETIVLSSGENLEPGPIEMRLRQSPLIEQCMVVGQDQKHLAALIIPTQEVKNEAENASALKKQLEAEVRNLINANNGFKSYERIRAIAVLDNAFEVGEELTPLFKLRRHVIDEKYQSTIAELFASHEK
jgi:long-chain acyl-CoA synthetase